MSTIDTQLSNVNIWEGTLDQIIGANIGENDLAFASDVDYEDKFRYSIMPVANKNLVGKIVQYIGGTNENYIQGAFYKCIKTDEVITPVVISATTESPNISNLVVTDSDNFLSQLTAKGIECKVGDTFTFSFNSSWGLWCYPSGTGNSYSLYQCMTYDGSAADGDEITFTYVSDTVYKYEWIEVKKEVVANWNNIEGDITENTELQEALESKQEIIQVTTLPAITEDNKDRIYQYVGETDAEHGLYQGSFYKAYGYAYEFSNEYSNLTEDISCNVINEQKFLQVIHEMFDNYAFLTSPTHLIICFTGTLGNTGYQTVWHPNASNDWVYKAWTETECGVSGGVYFGGRPTVNDSSDSSITSPNTRFDILVTKAGDDYLLWKWYPISIYPDPEDLNSQVLVNKSHYSHSIIERKSSDNWNSDGDYNTIIGVGSNGNSSGYSTVVGADNWGNYLSTVVGAHNRTIASASIVIGANTRGTSGEYGICIGVDSRAGERALAIGSSAQSYFRSIALGQSANASNNYDIALGSDSVASGSWSIAIGNNTKATSTFALALGYNAQAKAQSAVQIGEGINLTQGSLQFRNYVLVENNGTIPVPRLSADSPTNGYALTYDAESNRLIWTNPVPEIPEIQVEEMPTPTYAGKVVQYIGEDNGELVHGYFYTSVYNKGEDYYYWKQLNVQPTHSATDYNDISNKPQIEGITLEGDLSLSDLGIKQVALTGSYADLTTKPGINGHPLLANTKTSDLGIEYSDILNAPDPSSMLPTLPSDKDDYDYMLKWDHTLGRLTWIKAIDTHEDLGEL